MLLLKVKIYEYTLENLYLGNMKQVYVVYVVP